MALTNFEVIKLQQPDLNSANHLMKALKDRKSDRDFSTENLSLKHLSEIMWAAYGKNREDGKRTVPSAAALYPIKMYAVLSNGIYLYEPDRHELIPVVEGDYREFTGMPIAKVAPLNLVLIADYNKYQNTGNQMIDNALESPERRLRFASLDAGHSTQNVYLYCASEGIKALVRGSVDPKLLEIINPGDNHEFIVAQTVGY